MNTGTLTRTLTRAKTWRLHGLNPIWLVLAAGLAVLVWRDPAFAEPPSVMAFLKRSAPLVVLALGQLFVIVAGELDLSVGALVTAGVVVAARLGEGDGSRTWWVLAVLAALGLATGLVNGVLTAWARVPSFLATLGTMLVLDGAVFLRTGGSPTGALADNLRRVGRGSIEGVPVAGTLPYAVLVAGLAGLVAYLLLHHSRFGHRVFATGGGMRAAWLSGVDVQRVRLATFVLSAMSAVVAAVLLAGFAGLSANAGDGYEFQTIAAVVFGGAALGGGRGRVSAALGGALTLQVLFTLLNVLGFAKPLRDSVQGLTIIAAAAFTVYRQRRPR